MLFAVAMSISSTYFATKGAKLASKVSDKFLQKCLGCFMLLSVPIVIAKTAWWRHAIAQGVEPAEQSSAAAGGPSQMIGNAYAACAAASKRVAASLREKLDAGARLPQVSAAMQRVSETILLAQAEVSRFCIASHSKFEAEFPKTCAAASSLSSAAGLSEPGSIMRWVGYALVGAAGGCVSGLLGVGGGVVITPALAAFSSMPHLTILGTAMLTMIPAAISGVRQHMAARNILWPQAGALAAGSIVGATAGSNVALVVSEDMLRVVFAVMMTVFGARTLLR
jgi:uncharacterized membrane protein YfcA